MKAVVVYEKGKYEIRDVPMPKLNDGDVLIRINYAALCYRDLLQLAGYYPRMKYPVILGHEAVGVVVESRDPRFKSGNRVVPLLHEPDGVCEFCLRGLDSYCINALSYGENIDGFFAEYARVSGNALVKVPDEVPDELAVLVPCVIAMVYKGLRRVGLTQGETVVVTGASGGVGIHAVQLAKALGTRVIGVTRSPEKAGFIKQFADDVITEGKFSRVVKDLTGGIGADIVIEAVGTPTIEESIRSLRTGGRLVIIGNVNPDEVYPLRLGHLILKDISLVGNVRSNKPDVAETLKLLNKSSIKPIIAATYPLDKFNEALEHMKGSTRIGKVLIKP
ncbi:acryloyl-coenzyme A reductase [Vulcanisaeta souniana]|uniref:alcohol dehydrogenase n=1 Tax=Vulcanisaeta souniana JCM 11219 TaxID=1293586 RepID=A0A830E004_9CREN|nr:acryloyl-coenzyme A reductase [Vulcanisaeta souniana]BDR91470.1 alcohol dehydrogenase [Vulcanisaeta souniana JCM 11219]GGI73403.1 alcohol dehydrogenase [Vulcanisaeta souniana JCM 11219]